MLFLQVANMLCMCMGYTSLPHTRDLYFVLSNLICSVKVGMIAANNNCIPAHTGGNGSLIILHGARGSKPDPRLTDAIIGRSHDLRQPTGATSTSNDVLATLTELKPLQTYSHQPGYDLSPFPAPYDGAWRQNVLRVAPTRWSSNPEMKKKILGNTKL